MKKMWGLPLILLVMALTFACGDDSDGNDPLNGTWVDSDGDKLILNNGSFTMTIDLQEAFKGTYSTSGNNMTMTITQVHGSMFDEEIEIMGLESRWYTKSQMRSAIIANMVDEGYAATQAQAEAMYDEYMAEVVDAMYFTGRGSYTLSGNTLTLNIMGGSTTFTRR
jgi:hypothetical protein